MHTQKNDYGRQQMYRCIRGATGMPRASRIDGFVKNELSSTSNKYSRSIAQLGRCIQGEQRISRLTSRGLCFHAAVVASICTLAACAVVTCPACEDSNDTISMRPQLRQLRNLHEISNVCGNTSVYMYAEQAKDGSHVCKLIRDAYTNPLS